MINYPLRSVNIAEEQNAHYILHTRCIDVLRVSQRTALLHGINRLAFVTNTYSFVQHETKFSTVIRLNSCLTDTTKRFSSYYMTNDR
jgi:hypothetical protein